MTCNNFAIETGDRANCQTRLPWGAVCCGNFPAKFALETKLQLLMFRLMQIPLN